MRLPSLLCSLAVATLFAGGCASVDTRPAPMTREEIVQMAQGGAAAPAIIDRLRRTDTVLLLSAGDLVELARAGVPVEALDYLQSVQIAEIRRRDQFDRLLYSPMHPPFGPCPGWGPHPFPPVGGLRSRHWPYC